jgi:murein DD-endopeptidase MepM/ murein hydrolase activator NlpD
MKKDSHPHALHARDVVLGVIFATVAAAVLIGAIAALSGFAPTAEAKALKSLNHEFPVPSRHSYGDGVGAGCDHQGQDVFAKCGKRVLAARGGQVQDRAHHYAAGNYLVVDGRTTRVDYVYMHLRGSGLARQGERLARGERIAKVGQSGNAVGCHLHFEMWSRPGYYEGGHFMRSVTKHLRRWDRADG